MAALTIERLGPETRIAAGPVNVGLIGPAGGRIALVDAGNDEDAGRKLLRAAESESSRIGLIATTHSNADHCGGNAFIQARTACRIAATRIEAAFVEMPTLEPSCLWGGFPLPQLRSRFLMAAPSRVTDILEPPCALDLPAEGAAGAAKSPVGAHTAARDSQTEALVGASGEPLLQAIALPGHFYGMVGFMTRDRVFFAADAVASVEVLAKYHIFYLYDIEAQLQTLDMLERLEADRFVPSHARPVRDIRPLVAANRAKLLEIAEVLRGFCTEPETAENLLARLADHYGIVLNHTQYALVGSTLRSFLAWLTARKEIQSRIEGNRLLFAKA
jgi:glyoxylase-like metal-dependent hydrolase (beta-lactamase superfamily II)